MSVREIPSKPDLLAHFPDNEYRWLELHDDGNVYGYSAIKERDDMLELHISFSRWGSKVRRSLHDDVDWLKAEAKRLGKPKITGVRADSEATFDPMLFRFAKLYGFVDQCVFQTATLEVN